MKHLKHFLKITSVLSLAALLLGLNAGARTPVKAGAWKDGDPGHFAELKSMEYYLRWDHDGFRDHYAWHLIPPAKAELPPKYQEAFSFKVWPNHKKQTLQVEYHAQMVMDDSTYRSGKRQLDAEQYQALSKIMAQPLSCIHQVGQGWVGPSPEYLHLEYAKSAVSMYASQNKNGPEGPGAELREASKRRYLCNKALMDWLKVQIQHIEKSQ